MYKSKILKILISALLFLMLLPINVFAETEEKLTEIKKVEVNLIKPVVGNTVAFSRPTVSGSANYYVDGAYQLKPFIELSNGKCIVGDQVSIFDTFEKGKGYRYYITIFAKQGYTFPEDVEVVFTGDSALDVRTELYSHMINFEYTFYAGVDNPAPYTVNHYLEQYDGSFEKSNKVRTLYGVPGELATYDGNTKYDNYYMGACPEKVIDANGSTVLDIKYYLNKHLVTFDPNGEPGIKPKQVTYKFIGDLSLKEKIPVFEEYKNASRELECWSLTKDADSCAYYPGGAYEVPNSNEFHGIENVTLYAKYKVKHNNIENNKYVYDIDINNKDDIVIKYTTDDNSKVHSIIENSFISVNYDYVIINNDEKTITIKNEYFDVVGAGQYIWTIKMINGEGNYSDDINITINIPEKTTINPKVDQNGLAKIYVWENNEWKELTDVYSVIKKDRLKFKVDFTPREGYDYYGIKINGNIVTEDAEFELENPGDNLTIEPIIQQDVYSAIIDIESHNFGKSVVGLNSAVEQKFKITNKGNKTLFVTKDSLKNFEVSDFVLINDKPSVLNNEINGELKLDRNTAAEITIKPKNDLAIGKYEETLTIYFNDETTQPRALTSDNSFTKTIAVNYEVTPEQAKVDLSKNIDDAGTLSGAGTYNKGSEVLVKAVANNGYRFVRWTKDGEEVSTNSKYKFILDGNYELVAEFEKVDIIIETPESHDTGDSSNIYLYIVLSIISLSAVISLISLKKKYCK